MKRAPLLTGSVLFLLLCCSFYFTSGQGAEQSSKTRYLISENGKWGYIDKSGTVVIPTQFYSAQNYSEGLAPVRRNGLFGYADESGKFVIPELYDYAEPFHNGIARVYREGKSYLIDRAGKILFEHPYQSLGNFVSERLLPAATDSGRICLVDVNGKQLTGPDFLEIGDFHCGVSVVIQYTKSKAWMDRRLGVIDSSGKQIVPFGVYAEINDFSEGCAIARRERQEPNNAQEKTQWDCIDTKGKVVYRIPRITWRPTYTNSGYHEGLLVVHVYKRHPDSVKTWKNNNDYPGAVNREGEIVFADSAWKSITDFSHGRAFAQLEGGLRHWIMIDRNGKQVGDKTYRHVDRAGYFENAQGDFFENGKALVMDNNGWFFIDTNGTELSRQPKRRYYDDDALRTGDNVVIGESTNYIWIPGDTLLAKKWYGSVKAETLRDTLISVTNIDKEGKFVSWGYVDRTGTPVWTSKPEEKTLVNMNIDYMNRGYFMASSPKDSELDGIGGWGEYKNMFEPLTKLRSNYVKGKFQVIIDTTAKTDWYEQTNGYKVYVVNDTKQNYFFPAENSRIEMIIQAKDSKGNWTDIEYLPHSWCGNSYHTLHLSRNTFWTFAMPVYEGAMKTQLRAKLWCRTALNQAEDDVFYSNEINGSVNPAQFWRKREYFPNGIMDSYSE